MNERPETPMTYLGEMVAMSWRHGGELAGAAACAVTLAVVALVALSAHALYVLPSAIAAVVLFEASAAAWRLHRRQRIALATTRALLDLNGADRAELEHHLRARYRRREARIQERNADRLERLTDAMDALKAEVAGRTHRRIAM
jgi:biopolymer transport protein ExbB/TolQ